MRALVTGAYGFVGRHLIPELLKNGYDQVIAIDTRYPKDIGVHDRDEVFEKDPLDLNGVIEFKGFDFRTLLSKQPYTFGIMAMKLDLVVHLAANIVGIDKRMAGGIELYEDMVLDYEMCKWVEKAKPEVFVAMSSCAVDYPHDPYCIVKRTLEYMTKTLVKNGQKTIVLRPFSGYGYDQSDEYPFPSIMKRALAREDPLTVWGGDQVRDWLHIDDFVSGIIYGIDKFPVDATPIELGTCRGTSLRLFAREMAKSVGYNPGVEYNPEIRSDYSKPSSSMRRVAGENRGAKDSPILAQAFGWTHRIELRDGIDLELDKMKKVLQLNIR